jgi:hypothetical protein
MGLGAIFVATVGLMDRLIGPGYGRAGRLPQPAAGVISVVTAFGAVIVGALIWIRWF